MISDSINRKTVHREVRSFLVIRLTGEKVCDRINTYFPVVEWLCGKQQK